MTAHRSHIRRAAASAGVAAAALVLAACGGGEETSSSSDKAGSQASASASASAQQGEHNDADVAFATDMIPHHRQAVEMADLAPSRASSQEVKDLAAKIKKAQDPEINTMTGWLESWGEKVPEDMSGMDHDGMDHDMGGMDDMPGMMSAEDMEALEKAKGAEFDTAFLEMMIEHHEGAVEMAKTEKSEGAYPPAKELADEIITSQTAEIKQMNEILGQ